MSLCLQRRKKESIAGPPSPAIAVEERSVENRGRENVAGDRCTSVAVAWKTLEKTDDHLAHAPHEPAGKTEEKAAACGWRR
nr:hypothetical protein Itr_chr02CG12460 [Ipomoea trifida]